VVDFQFTIIEHFSLALTVQILVEVGVFQRGVSHFKRKFQVEVDIGHKQICWYQKTGLINLACGFKISAVCSFVSLQSTRVTDRQTDRQNYDPQDCANIAALRGKKCDTAYMI